MSDMFISSQNFKAIAQPTVEKIHSEIIKPLNKMRINFQKALKTNIEASATMAFGMAIFSYEHFKSAAEAKEGLIKSTQDLAINKEQLANTKIDFAKAKKIEQYLKIENTLQRKIGVKNTLVEKRDRRVAGTKDGKSVKPLNALEKALANDSIKKLDNDIKVLEEQKKMLGDKGNWEIESPGIVEKTRKVIDGEKKCQKLKMKILSSSIAGVGTAILTPSYLAGSLPFAPLHLILSLGDALTQATVGKRLDDPLRGKTNNELRKQR